MTMHEINAAAEAITTAADPDANIIFGATINPQLEGEIIITVVATGFDAAYFASREKAVSAATSGLSASLADDDEDEARPKDDATVMTNLDMDLDEDKEEATGTDFHSDSPMPNIWTLDHHTGDPVVSGDHDNRDDDAKPNDNESPKEEDELERPSFLRRLKNRKNDPKKEL